jgi:hypothetical protein
MGNMPFELFGRRLEEGGVRLLFRCTACGGETSLVLADADALQEKYPVACSCGVEVNMFFGSPLVGKALISTLKKLREPEDTYHHCRSPLLN